ncbi:hypothetical protein SGCOL_010398 [Colletotrichum sp. CLE4]
MGRYVAKRKLESDLQGSKRRFANMIGGQELKPDSETVSGHSDAMKRINGGGLTPKTPGHFKIGIVGSGVAIDWINETIAKEKGSKHLNISYEILDSSNEKRFGGRLYTHRFSEDGVHDYYDIGAMRYPKNAVMDKYATNQLFKCREQWT